MGQNKSFYLADDVLEYLSRHENASAEVTKLVRRKIARDAEAAAYERANEVPLTEERRSRARGWAREQLAAAAERAESSREARDEVRRRMGWDA
jgi:hypothetical protein